MKKYGLIALILANVGIWIKNLIDYIKGRKVRKEFNNYVNNSMERLKVQQKYAKMHEELQERLEELQ